MGVCTNPIYRVIYSRNICPSLSHRDPLPRIPAPSHQAALASHSIYQLSLGAGQLGFGHTTEQTLWTPFLGHLQIPGKDLTKRETTENNINTSADMIIKGD